jgi:hypothetical protein
VLPVHQVIHPPRWLTAGLPLFHIEGGGKAADPGRLRSRWASGLTRIWASGPTAAAQPPLDPAPNRVLASHRVCSFICLANLLGTRIGAS